MSGMDVLVRDMHHVSGMRTITTLAFVAISAAGCAASGQTAVRSSQPIAETVTPAMRVSVTRGVIGEVNRTRQAQGRSALIANDALNQAAQRHAEEIARRGELSHRSTDPALRTMAMRVEAVGIQWRAAAENLAASYGPNQNVPAEIVRMWLGSEGHRRNMLSADYTHTGVGVAHDGRSLWYVVQLYVTPR